MALFTCGLVDDPLPLLQHIHRMFIDWKARAIARQADVDIQPEEDLYKGLCSEAKIEVPAMSLVTLKGLRKYFKRINKNIILLFLANYFIVSNWQHFVQQMYNRMNLPFFQCTFQKLTHLPQLAMWNDLHSQ